MIPHLPAARPCRQRQSSLAAVAAVAAILAGPAAADWNRTPETLERGYPTWIFSPPAALPDGRHPLLVVLHGCDQSHTQLKEFGNLEQVAIDNGVVVAVPAVDRRRAFGPGCWKYDSGNQETIDAVVRLTGKLKDRASLKIHPDHVYIVGLSSGAAMALAAGCRAPHVFAGIGAVAGPSVGSSQIQALTEASAIPPANVSTAIGKCKALAGNKASHFDTQIASVGFGDMDRNGPKARFDFSSGATEHAGQWRVVSIKWTQDNVAVLQSIYGSGALGPAAPVQNGLGTVQVAKNGDDPRLSLLVVHDVGHAWPAGTGRPNDFSQGGNWIAQSGLNYPMFIVDWLISHNRRADFIGGRPPELTAAVSGSPDELKVTGTAKDPDGTIASVDTMLLQADDAGTFVRKDSHLSIDFDAGRGTYSDRYTALPMGWYKAQVTATDNANKTSTQLTAAEKVGNPPPLTPCREFSDNNFTHVLKGRAVLCRGFTCAKGSNDNLGLFSVGVTSTVIEASPGFYRKGSCP